MNSTWLGLVLSTTESLFNNDTLMEEITEEEDEEDVNEWFDFEIQGKIYMTCILIIASLGVVGNVMSFILMSDAKLRSLAYSVYLRWMAVSDSLLLMMVAAEDTLDTYHYLQRFLTSDVTLCKVWVFFLTMTYTLSPWLVVALTLDRFVCVVFPLSRHRLCTKSKAFKLCLTLTLISAALNVYSLIYIDIEDAECLVQSPDQMEGYLLIQQLVLNSILPCAAVLILNIVTVIRIRRSATFRQQFKRSGGSEATKERQDKITLPLLLVSIFAFVTLIPRAVTEVTEYVLDVFQEHDGMTMELANKLWPLFNLIYLVNFGQNFYILMASSSEYRLILRRKLTWHKDNRNTSSAQTQSSRMSSEFSEISVSKMTDSRSVTSGDTTLMSSLPVTEPGI
ncbi:probable G-protein coupled receptor B0563.6 [Gigantopelta aegis]|uniref:probable G-protein coupled receptor B0563.6 n=1 Tax=Gigantopelta aegis TaxID=1735272 RepID=UPI001B88A90C|nr:probable G-protein coupled receptor B0563.6 [Gigantopelta aegis]